jgi:hypothetical protein
MVKKFPKELPEVPSPKSTNPV